MHHATETGYAQTIAIVTPVMEHWLEQEIAQRVHHEGSIKRPIAPWANALTTELHLAAPSRICLSWNGMLAALSSLTPTTLQDLGQMTSPVLEWHSPSVPATFGDINEISLHRLYRMQGWTFQILSSTISKSNLCF